MMKCCLMTMCFLVLAATSALAQGKKSVPPPPKPAEAGPSLEVTMTFIQDELNDVGRLNFIAYYHDNADGDDWTNQFRNQATKIVSDPGTCRINYHWKVEIDGAVTQDLNSSFLFKDVRDIAVMSIEQVQKELDTAAGHPSWNAKVDPPVFSLKVRGTDKHSNYFYLYDEQMANRLAKAMLHAVELCGGGSEPEPF